MAWLIRPARIEELPQILAIEEACFVDPWTMPMLEKEFFHQWSHFLVLIKRDPLGVVPDDIVGFCLYWVVLDEYNLMQVAVSSDFRGQGLGRRLMETMIAEARHAEAACVFLEVRASNQAALALYRGLGFVQIGVRHKYYEEPEEDALVLTLSLPQGPALRP